MSPRLADLQRWFAGAITHRGPLTEGIAKVACGVDDPLTLLTAGPGRSPLARLGTYHHAYRARLVECLADDYPAVRAALGEEAFSAQVHGYADAHPSRSPNLNGFGRAFAQFVAAGGEPLPDEGARAYLADLATLEWALVEVVHAEASRPLTLATLAALAPESWATARLRTSDTVRLLAFSHPVPRAFQAFCETGALTLPRPVPVEPSHLLVYRQELTTFRLTLDPTMAALCQALVGGAPLAVALDAAAAATTEPLEALEQRVMIHFREWVECGVFASIDH